MMKLFTGFITWVLKYYFRNLLTIERQCLHSSVIVFQSPLCNTSFGNKLDPIPTQVAPALNHADRFSSVGSTPPVTMIFDHGIGPFMFFMNEGPPTLPPGNTFTISAPNSWAKPISVGVAHPGE